jgi:RNA polymerase sigma-70 factor (ECF subfamily)
MDECDLLGREPPLLTSFTALVEREHHALYVFLRGLVNDSEQAYDLMQDTFHDAWRAALAGTAPLATSDEMRRWLFQAAYHRAISALRRRRLIRWESLDQLADPEAVWGTEAVTFEDQIAESEALREALAHLSPQDSACLLLRLAHGFSAAEVGQIIGATPDVVTKRLSRAKQRLRSVYLRQNTPTKELSS